MWRNRTVCLAAITMALEAAGCTFQNSEPSGGGGYHSPGSGQPAPGNSRPRESGLGVSWDLAYLDGVLTDCGDAGTPTVNMAAVQRSTGSRFTASFPCDDGVGFVGGIAPGFYEISLDLVDPLGRPVSTVYHPGVQVHAGTVTELAEPALFPVQAWDLLWTIGVGRRAVACGDVGAVTVRFVTQLHGEPAETYDLPCGDYGAVSTAIRPGDYQVRLMLLDYRGQPLSDTGFGPYRVTFDEIAELDADFLL